MFKSSQGLWWVLAVAVAVRLAPMLCQAPIGRDIAEFRNLAANMRHGNGYTLDIKAYRAVPVPVVHYGVYERPVLFPVLLSAMELAVGPGRAARVIGPLLFVLALALVWVTLAREIGPNVATGTGLLLAVHPALFQLSLLPLSEAAVLAALGLVFWAFFRRRSAVLTGMACTVAFLARPNLLLMAALIALYYLGLAWRRGRWGEFLLFALFAAIGPAWMVAFNLRMGAPALTLPQAFLFRVLNHLDVVHYAHRGPVYPSAAALLAAQWPAVAHKIGLNALHYAQDLWSLRGLAALVPLVPLAAVGLRRDPALRRYWLLAAIVAADLALFTLTWATADGLRFLVLAWFFGIVLVAVGAFELLDREALLKWRGASRSAAMLALGAVALVWFLMDVYRGYVTVREWQLGRPGDGLAAIWNAPGVNGLVRLLAPLGESTTDARRSPVVASNEPWMVNARTGLPAVILPYDLRGGEWPRYLAGESVDFVVLHHGEWPDEHADNLAELSMLLGSGGWELIEAEGEIECWRRPLSETRPAASEPATTQPATAPGE